MGAGSGGVQRGVIVHRHVGERVAPGHGEGEHAGAVGILAQIDAADQEIVVDDLEYVIEALPWRIQILEQNVFPRLERARIVPHRYFYLF